MTVTITLEHEDAVTLYFFCTDLVTLKNGLGDDQETIDMMGRVAKALDEAEKNLEGEGLEK